MSHREDAQEHASSPEMATDRPCVLIVDDQLDVREFLRDVLGDEFDVVVAANGRAALNLITHGGLKPLVAIVDILMPEKDGIETILEMKQHSPSLRVIAMSGGSRVMQFDFLEIASRLGAELIARKPIDAAAMREMVRSLSA